MTFISGPWRMQGSPLWQPKHVEWINAANSLPFYERIRAYLEIAQMMGIDQDRVVAQAARQRKTNKRYLLAAE